MNIKTIVREFAERLSALVENRTLERARDAVLSAVGAPPRRGPGRPPKALGAIPAAKKQRKKAPRQLCPVPGCKNPAAPVFGMVCAKHKDLPKAKIKKFRDARRAKKLGLPPPKARKRRVAKPRVTKQASPRASAAVQAAPPSTSPSAAAP